jgi:hypothetical protein
MLDVLNGMFSAVDIQNTDLFEKFFSNLRQLILDSELLNSVEKSYLIKTSKGQIFATQGFVAYGSGHLRQARWRLLQAMMINSALIKNIGMWRLILGLGAKPTA